MSTSDLFSIAGKTALVTGGSRGIGKMIAQGFVEAGATVYISSRKAEVCAEVAAELSAYGTCIALPADLSTEAECRRLADELAARVERLDILVNNAGATWGAPLAEFDEAAFERVLALNVKGVFHLTKFCVPLLQAAGTAEEPARVINIGSIDGLRVPVLETYAYSVSKAAVHQLTRHLAKRLAPVQDDGQHPRSLRRPDRPQRAAQADRPARRHGRRRHLPGQPGRGLSHRGPDPGGRGHRHVALTTAPDRGVE